MVGKSTKFHNEQTINAFMTSILYNSAHKHYRHLVSTLLLKLFDTILWVYGLITPGNYTGDPYKNFFWRFYQKFHLGNLPGTPFFRMNSRKEVPKDSQKNVWEDSQRTFSKDSQ